MEVLDRLSDSDFALTPECTLEIIVHKPDGCEVEGSVHAAVARVLSGTKLSKLCLVGFGFANGERSSSSGRFQAFVRGMNSKSPQSS